MGSTLTVRRRVWSGPRILGVATCLTLLAPSAWAALGQTADSVVADQQRLQGELRSTSAEGFSVQEITAADGSVVKEYLARGGVVFGVSWRGVTSPDLAQLLGSHFEEFQQASRSATRQHRPLVVRTPQVVVEIGGHMRAFQGRAYLPGSLPDAVSSSVVR